MDSILINSAAEVSEWMINLILTAISRQTNSQLNCLPSLKKFFFFFWSISSAFHQYEILRCYRSCSKLNWTGTRRWRVQSNCCQNRWFQQVEGRGEAAAEAAAEEEEEERREAIWNLISWNDSTARSATPISIQKLESVTSRPKRPSLTQLGRRENLHFWEKKRGEKPQRRQEGDEKREKW